MTRSDFRHPLLRLSVAWAVSWSLLLAPLAVDAQAPARAKAEQGVTLNLQNTDIDAAARAMASVLGKPVIVDPRVKGQVTIVTDGPVSKDNALAQFGGALRAQGFAMVEASGLIKVVPEADAKLQGGAVTVGSANVAPRGEQIVTQVIKLNYENAANLVPVLRPLIAPNNTINANLGNNSLIITDYAENLRRIARIVAALDVPNSTDLEIIPLKYSVASDVVNTINRLLEGTAPPGVPGQTGVGGVVLADARTNSLMVRATNPARMALIKSLVDKLDAASKGEGNLHVVYLKNAQADKLAEILRNLLAGQSGTVGSRSNAPLGGGGLSQAMSGGGAPGLPGSPPQGLPASAGGAAAGGGASGGAMGAGVAVQADLASNALIITAPEPLYKQLRGVIDQLDTRRAQVYIEALVAEVDNSKLDEFGVQWQALARNANNTSGIYVGTNLPNTGAGLLGLQAAAASGNAAAAAGAIGDLRGLNFAVVKKIGGIVTIPALARALETSGDGNVLSTPNILALDNEEAKFSSGQNVPFITGQFTNTGAAAGSVNPFQTIERKDVGIQLKVRPQISEGGTIKLQIYLEVSSVASSTNAAGIITNKSSIENTIIVDDGQMIALGGLLKDGYSSTRDKVPVLGDIPVLGGLFRYEKRQRDKVNLMIFLRPVIIRDADTAATLLQDRYDQMRAATQATQPEMRLWSQDMGAPVLPPLPAASAPAKPKAPASGSKGKGPTLGDASLND